MLMSQNYPHDISTHDLTRRSTTERFVLAYPNSYFNSRPHKEVDNIYAAATRNTDISTHDLTRRSTNIQRLPHSCRRISTHDLTRRSTVARLLVIRHDLHFNSRPHKEVDLAAVAECFAVDYFNSRPHKEVDTVTLTMQ